jgi:hypothetical protein
LTIGNVTLKWQGRLDFDKDGRWNLIGKYEAFDDRYDFDPSRHRLPTGEALTTIGRNMPGQPYWMDIRGSVPVTASGKNEVDNGRR